MKRCYYTLCLLTCCFQTYAAPISQLEQTHTRQEMAKQWHMSPKDYQHYKWLMAHTANGHWYKQLDPAEVLALNTNSPQQMLKYAKIEAKLNHHRIQQEFLFNNIYHQAYKTLYPTEKPIMSQAMRKQIVNQIQPGDHIWFFIHSHNAMSDVIFPHLLHLLKTNPNTYLDIYFTDHGIQSRDIQTWAMRHQLPPDLLNHRVSLNVDAHRLSTVSNNQSVVLPYIGIVRNQHFQAISPASVMG